MSKERYAEHPVTWELPNGDSVTKGNYNLSDIGTKYIPIQTEIVSDSKDHTIDELQQRIAELEEQLKNSTKQVRKEVCEEIRNWCDKNFNWVGDGTGYDGQDYNEMIGSNNTINKLRELLDQIEKGESEYE